MATNSSQSKITAFMEVLKPVIDRASGISPAIIIGQQSIDQVIGEATARADGQAIAIIPVSGTNPTPEGAAQMDTTFQVQVYDNPSMRVPDARPGYEIMEAIIPELQDLNAQDLNSICKDTKVTGWTIEILGGADLYTLTVEAKFHYIKPSE